MSHSLQYVPACSLESRLFYDLVPFKTDLFVWDLGYVSGNSLNSFISVFSLSYLQCLLNDIIAV